MNASRLIGATILAAVAAPLVVRAQAPTTATETPWVKVSVEQTASPTLTLTASPHSYVVVVRVSDDRKVHVLYPASPIAQQPFPEGPGAFRIPLDVPKYSMGGIYAAASDIPFNFGKIANGSGWNGDALILKSSSDAQHAANRVLGVITPLSARVTSAEVVYMGTGSATRPNLFANATRLYLPVSVGYTPDDGCSTILNRYDCGRTGFSSRGSPYLGCLMIDVSPRTSRREERNLFCGTVYDLFVQMARSLPQRTLASPLAGTAATCGGVACSVATDFSRTTSRWHPSADYTRPRPVTTPAATSPTPLPAPSNPPTNPITIPPASL